MENEVVGPSGRKVQQDSTTGVSSQRYPTGQRVHNNNVSVQTGEEFSLNFYQDRTTSRRVANIPDVDQAQLKRGRFNINQNSNVAYEDLTGILGLRRMNSECSYDASDLSLRKGCMEVESSSHQASRYYENGADGKEPKQLFQEMTNNQAGSGPLPPRISVSGSPHSPAPGSGASDGSKPGKIKFLCSFGGKILPRPSDAKLRYVGGETRIINIRKNLSWVELVKKTSEICHQPHIIKYQLPGEDLDALISVSSDEDLLNMLEEYQGLERVDGQRLRLFLISPNDSESPSSFEARGSEQSSSEYQYVVALNGIMDPSPRKSFGPPLGQNWDGSPNVHKDFPNPVRPLEGRDSVSPSNVMGMVSRPSAQFFMNSKSASKSPNQSPSYSPLLLQRRDSKGSNLHLCDDQSFQGSNESNNSLITDQPQQDNYVMDGTGYYYPTPDPIPLINHHHQTQLVDADKPNKSRGVHFQEWKPTNENAHPTAIGRNHSDLDSYSCERPMLKERAFHSEKLLFQGEDHMGLLSGSEESVGSHLGMPHVYSDSVLLEHGVKCIQSSQEGNTPLSPLDFPSSTSPALVSSAPWHRGPVKQEENEGYLHHIQKKQESTDSTSPRRKMVMPEFSLFPEISVKEEHSRVAGSDEKSHEAEGVSNLMSLDHYPENPAMRLDMLNLMDENDSLLPQASEHQRSSIQSKVSRTMSPVSSLTVLENHSKGCELDMMTSELGVRSQRPTMDGSRILDNRVQTEYRNEDNVLSCMSSMSRSQDADVADSNRLLPHDSVRHPSIGASSGQVDMASKKEKGRQEPVPVDSVRLDPFLVKDKVGPRLEVGSNESSFSWSSFQKAHADTSSRRVISLLDSVHESYKDQKRDKVGSIERRFEPSTSEDVSMMSTDSAHVIQLESVIVEDVTDSMPHDIQSSTRVVPHVDEDIQSPRLTEVESIAPESDYEDIDADDGDRDESISDAAIAEMEAGIYGLQIIRNADLEELRELGSGTFGTVYHGKWRGTDVAIKRIKKSCFSGRSSEQERLTKDFWREAQILSKLHHPNVVAFYGVVPDGAGGTLATVTEFMVNGSLRHVLLRKDRLLDRRKRLIIAMDAAFGMEYLHSKNIVHFDLKCDNLLVNLRDPQRPICKVGDFGLSTIKRNTLVSGGVREPFLGWRQNYWTVAATKFPKRLTFFHLALQCGKS
ncbi:mitogen-activated protein kinase kinase kinase [Ranunculus cassubicifolius]